MSNILEKNEFVEYNLDALFSLSFWKVKAKNNRKLISFWGLFWRYMVFVLLPIVVVSIMLISMTQIDLKNNINMALLVLIGGPIGIFAEMIMMGVALKHYSKSLIGQNFLINDRPAYEQSFKVFSKIFWSFSWRFWVFKITIFAIINLIVLALDLITHKHYLDSLLESESWTKAGFKFSSDIMMLFFFMFLIIFGKMKVKKYYIELRKAS